MKVVDFRICTVGTGTGVPRVKRRAPATLVKINKYLLLFDTGPGTLRALEEAGRSFERERKEVQGTLGERRGHLVHNRSRR